MPGVFFLPAWPVLRAAGAALWLVACLTACSGLMERRPPTPLTVEELAAAAAAREVLAKLDARNPGLSAVKGLGSFSVWQQNSAQRARIAWVGKRPDKLRLLLRDISGVPIATLANDGTWFYLDAHSEGRFYRKSARDDTLRRLLAVAISTEEVVLLLSGRIPLRPFQTAVLQPEPVSGAEVVRLQDSKGRLVEKIYLDPAGQGGVRRIEMFDNGDTLLYGVDFSGSLNVSGYLFPSALTVFNAAQPVFRLQIERCWVNPELTAEVFRLSPGEEGRPQPGPEESRER
jgi:hypothetical protein